MCHMDEGGGEPKCHVTVVQIFVFQPVLGIRNLEYRNKLKHKINFVPIFGRRGPGVYISMSPNATYGNCNGLKCISVCLYLICKLSKKCLSINSKEIPCVYKVKPRGVLVDSDNQNIHQLLHRLALEQTITNLRYGVKKASHIN